mgnify:CR=1 FL=1
MLLLDLYSLPLPFISVPRLPLHHIYNINMVLRRLVQPIRKHFLFNLGHFSFIFKLILVFADS